MHLYLVGWDLFKRLVERKSFLGPLPLRKIVPHYAEYEQAPPNDTMFRNIMSQAVIDLTRPVASRTKRVVFDITRSPN